MPVVLKIGKIDDLKAPAFFTAFKTIHPKPTTGPDAALSDKKWAEKVLREALMIDIDRVNKRLAMESVVPDPTLVEEDI